MSRETESTDKPQQAPRLESHPMVAKLGAEGMTPRELLPLVGYIGPSPHQEEVRLYKDPSFRSYYDIPRSAVVHTEPLDANDNNSPTRVLVNASARIAQTQISVQVGEARFLQGAITQGFLPAAAAPAPAQSWPTCGTFITVAPTHCATGPVVTFGCQTNLLGCTTVTTPPGAPADAQAIPPVNTMPPPTYLMGCTTVTTPPTYPGAQAVPPVHTLPWTHFPGCTTVTTPPTHLGAQAGPFVNTLPPPTYLMGCTTVTTPPTYLMGCTTVTTPPGAAAGAQPVPPIHALPWTHFCTVPPVSIGCPPGGSR